MTKTSEGPAGMSIDTIASLFCSQRRIKKKRASPDLCGVWGRVSVASLTLACAMRGPQK